MPPSTPARGSGSKFSDPRRWWNHEIGFAIARKRSDPIWNLTRPSGSIKNTSIEREALRGHATTRRRWDFATTGIPRCCRSRLKPPAGGVADSRRAVAVHPPPRKMFCIGGSLRPSRHPAFRRPLRISRHEYDHLPLSWMDVQCRRRSVRRGVDRRTRFADRRQSESENLCLGGAQRVDLGFYR